MERFFSFGLSLMLIGVAVTSAHAQSSPEQNAIDAASKTYDKEVETARQAYEEALARASKKLIGAYDTSIRTAMRRGGGDGLDVANKLNEDKKKLMAWPENAGEKNGGVEKVTQTLTGRTWYWHWEQPNKDIPMKFLADGGIVDKDGTLTKNKWTAEKKLVVTINDHEFIQVNDNLFRGFYNSSGRQTGMMADPKK